MTGPEIVTTSGAIALFIVGVKAAWAFIDLVAFASRARISAKQQREFMKNL